MIGVSFARTSRHRRREFGLSIGSDGPTEREARRGRARVERGGERRSESGVEMGFSASVAPTRQIEGARRRAPAFVLAVAVLGPMVALAAPASVAATPAMTGLASPLSAMEPTVEKVLPKNGPEAGGTNVMITGANLNGATAVEFGSTSASFTAKSATTLKAVAPAGTGTVDVTVTTPEGTSAIGEADHFSYIPKFPVVTGVFPTQ